MRQILRSILPPTVSNVLTTDNKPYAFLRLTHQALRAGASDESKLVSIIASGLKWLLVNTRQRIEAATVFYPDLRGFAPFAFRGRHHNGAGSAVHDIVVTARPMVDHVSPASPGPALKPDNLIDEL